MYFIALHCSISHKAIKFNCTLEIKSLQSPPFSLDPMFSSWQGPERQLVCCGASCISGQPNIQRRSCSRLSVVPWWHLWFARWISESRKGIFLDIKVGWRKWQTDFTHLHPFGIHLKGSWRIELNGLIRVHKIWFILPWPWTSCTSAQEPSDHPGVPESLAFDIFWPLKVSEGQGAKFAEFLLRAFEFQELNLNFKEIDRESKFRWISYFSVKSC